MSPGPPGLPLLLLTCFGKEKDSLQVSTRIRDAARMGWQEREGGRWDGDGAVSAQLWVPRVLPRTQE